MAERCSTDTCLHFLATTCLALHLPTKVFASFVIHDHLPFPRCKHLPSPESNHLPRVLLLTGGERPLDALPLLYQRNLHTQRDSEYLGELDRCFTMLMCCTDASPRPYRVHDDAGERRRGTMVSKATHNGFPAANTEQSTGAGRRTNKKGSRVPQARAHAQRAKRDALAQTHQQQQEQEAAVHQTQNKKAVRQETQAKRRVIETLIEAYIQDHIGGNSSAKTLEWHRTALGLMHLFLKEELDITHIDEVEADDISAWFAHMRSTPAATGKVRSDRTIQTYARSARAFFHC